MSRSSLCTAGIALALLSRAVLAAEGDVTRASVLQEALKVARTIPSLEQRATAMAEIGIAIAAEDPALAQAVLAEAKATAVLVPSQIGQALALIAVARRVRTLDPKAADAILSQAAAATERMPFPAQRSLVLAQLALAKPDAAHDEATALLAKAAEQARSVPESPARIAALRDVSAAYAPLDPAAAVTLCDEALKTAKEQPAGVESDLALADLAGFIARRDLEQAVATAGLVTDAGAKSEALRGLALAAAPQDPARALQFALNIPDAPGRVATLADLALAVCRAAPDVARAAADKAAAAAQSLPADDTGNEARANAAAARAATDVDEGLAAARKVADPYFVDLALSRIALLLARSNPDRALGITEEIQREVLRGDPLCALVAGLAERDPRRAYELAGRIRARDRRVGALLALTARLPASVRAGGP
jgi:hypothetical protein